MKKIFLIAGEVSGDTHGARLVKEMKRLDSNLEFYGLGGLQMKEAGVNLSTDLTRISVLGLTDVLKKYFIFRKIFYQTLKQISELKPDLVILIDYPGFNLRLAKKIKKRFPVLYYISPQIWAWGGRRMSVIKKHIDKLIVFFPFEKQLYDLSNVPCTFVGHPLVDEIAPSPPPPRVSNQKLVVGLLAGSRESEVKRILPTLLKSALIIQEKYPDITFIVSESSNITESIYDQIFKNSGQNLKIKIVRGKPYEVIRDSDILAVTSGTATLETALHGKPFVLVYKAAWLTYVLGRMLIQVRFLGIVNLLGKRRIVPELIQMDLTDQNLAKELELLITNPEAQKKQVEAFLEIRRELATGNSVGLAALEIIRFLQSSNRDRLLKENLAN